MPVLRKDLLRHASRKGLLLEEGGKHGKIVHPETGTVFPYPRGSNAKELPDSYLRGYCRAFGFDIDKVREEL
jgi:hypothetical protein